MKKVVKIKDIVSRPLAARYLYATGAERASLKPLVEEESSLMIDRMKSKGYRLDATVADVLGVFTRGPAKGAVKIVTLDPDVEPATKGEGS